MLTEERKQSILLGGLSCHAVMVADAIAEAIAGDGGTGCCRSYSDLSEATGMSGASVQRALKELRGAGFVTSERTKATVGGTLKVVNTFRLAGPLS